MSEENRLRANRRAAYEPRKVQHGLKPKDLVGIPWRVAFALQADGWYLRSDIIWSKPNPMPESVTDRPTKAHEYLFLLTKSPRYYFDADAVREASLDTGGNGNFAGRMGGARDTARSGGHGTEERPAYAAGRNLRSVWTIATEPYPGAHFATFPRKLVEPCVKAGTSERGVCPECGAPWTRTDAGASTFDENRPQGRRAKELWQQYRFTPEHLDAVRAVGITDTGKAMVTQSGTGRNDPEVRRLAAEVKLAMRGYYREALLVKRLTTFAPSCKCGDGIVDRPSMRPVPAVVLDPFAGSGTTLLVAQALGRRGIGIDLNPDYLKQALVRNAQTPLGLIG
jgi:hypothetical protein